MKVVSAKQMAYIESLAYQGGASEEEFMEEAGSGVALVVHDYIEKHRLSHRVILLCGKGNNAGDAYVAGVHLLHLDYDVYALQLAPIDECTALCQENFHRFMEEGGNVKFIKSPDEITFSSKGVVLDGIFGTGFKGKVEGNFAAAIRLANESKLPIIAVDIPSGLEGETGIASGQAIKAVETAFLGLPKIGFFLKEGWNHVGRLRYVDFGLPKQYIEQSSSDLIMLHSDIVKPFLPKIVRNRHKYARGYVVGVAGSPDMPGAAIMSSYAALRGGAGIVRLLYPKGMESQLSSAPFELIKLPFAYDNPRSILETMERASAVFIGPGMGRGEEAKQLLKEILPKVDKPCVIDVDALYILSQEKIQLPRKTILTPHTGELARLMGIPLLGEIDSRLLKDIQAYTEENNVTLIMKGGPTFVFQPNEPVIVSPKGDPGMATAASGDLLTGLLAALLAQGLEPYHAAMLGVYLHGVAGEHAAEELTSYCVMASDILYYFPEAFRFIEI